MTMCRTCIRTSTSTRNCWKKSPADLRRPPICAAALRGRLLRCCEFFVHLFCASFSCILFVHPGEVFNILVEKSEEKRAAIVVTASLSYVSALCTARGAGGLAL